jgi:biotin operon repressor
MGHIMAKIIKCYLCETGLDKNSVGLNKKLLDKKPKRFLCIDCLAAHLDVSMEDLCAKIEEFKAEGCKMFL